MIELLFRLEQDEEGWPPASVEGLWCEPEGVLHRVLTCPLFVKGLSVGDVIKTHPDDRGEIAAFDVVEPSLHTTIWLLFSGSGIEEQVLVSLRAAGCKTTGSLAGFAPRLCSVDVPGELDIRTVDAVLQPFEQAQQLAVAYPSFRHPDDD